MSFLTNSQRKEILRIQQVEERKRKDISFFNKAKMEHLRFLAEQERRNKRR